MDPNKRSQCGGALFIAPPGALFIALYRKRFFENSTDIVTLNYVLYEIVIEMCILACV